MPLISPKTIIPKLIEEIFTKHEAKLKELQDKGEFKRESARKFLLELDAVFGDNLRKALRIVDEKIIKIYTAEEYKTIQIVEIFEGYKSGRIIRLLANVNFCMCSGFARSVLKLDVDEEPSSSLTTTIPAKPFYTCQHVLALRLAKILQAPSLRYEKTSKQCFDMMLTSILPEAVDEKALLPPKQSS